MRLKLDTPLSGMSKHVFYTRTPTATCPSPLSLHHKVLRHDIERVMYGEYTVIAR